MLDIISPVIRSELPTASTRVLYAMLNKNSRYCCPVVGCKGCVVDFVMSIPYDFSKGAYHFPPNDHIHVDHREDVVIGYVRHLDLYLLPSSYCEPEQSVTVKSNFIVTVENKITIEGRQGGRGAPRRIILPLPHEGSKIIEVVNKSHYLVRVSCRQKSTIRGSCYITVGYGAKFISYGSYWYRFE